MTRKRPETKCIMCQKPTEHFTERNGKVTGFNMGMCPECVAGLKGKRPESDAESDAETTEEYFHSDCEVCGEPIDYCQGHGEIASSM